MNNELDLVHVQRLELSSIPTMMVSPTATSAGTPRAGYLMMLEKKWGW